MEAYKENIIKSGDPFPVDVFIQDNNKSHVCVASHWHDCIEILYMLDGNAVQQVNSRHFNVYKNDILILNKGDIHGTWCKVGDNTKILVIKFLPDIIDNTFSPMFESRYILAFLHNKSSQTFYIPNTLKAYKDISNLFIGIYNEFLNKRSGYEIFIKGYIYQLIAVLIRNDILETHELGCKEDSLSRLGPLLKYIDCHYYEEITLEIAAKMVNMSYYHFSRFFKNATGRNFKEYIDFVRVCEAEKLMLSQNINISSAAYEVGFKNVSSFNRVYKRVRNYPPSVIIKAKTAKD